jgi:hypothetical protein
LELEIQAPLLPLISMRHCNCSKLSSTEQCLRIPKAGIKKA